MIFFLKIAYYTKPLFVLKPVQTNRKGHLGFGRPVHVSITGVDVNSLPMY